MRRTTAVLYMSNARFFAAWTSLLVFPCDAREPEDVCWNFVRDVVLVANVRHDLRSGWFSNEVYPLKF